MCTFFINIDIDSVISYFYCVRHDQLTCLALHLPVLELQMSNNSCYSFDKQEFDTTIFFYKIYSSKQYRFINITIMRNKLTVFVLLQADLSDLVNKLTGRSRNRNGSNRSNTSNSKGWKLHSIGKLLNRTSSGSTTASTRIQTIAESIKIQLFAT